MPLPDADKKSPRVYTLSQNTDLENMAFATMQSIGQPINIEEMNEDELRRLVLVNLARLAVKGEWDGLLSAGSGGSALYPAQISAALDASGINYVRWCMTSYFTNDTTTGNNKHFTNFIPFIAAASGDVAEIGLITNATSTITLYGGIYSADPDDNSPKTRLTYGTFTTGSSGILYDTSLTGTATLVKGTMYWAAFTTNSTATVINMDMAGLHQPILWPIPDPPTADFYYSGVSTNSNETSLKSSYTADDLRPSPYVSSYIPQMTYKFG